MWTRFDRRRNWANVGCAESRSITTSEKRSASGILDDGFPNGVAPFQCCGIPKNEERAPRASNGNVGTPSITQESNGTDRRPRTYAREDDDVLLLTLEAIDGIEIDRLSRLLSKPRSEHATQTKHLFSIHRNDTDPIVEVDALELRDNSLIQGHDRVSFSLIDQRMAHLRLAFFAFDDIKESERSKEGVCMPGSCGLGSHIGAVGKLGLVEERAGKLTYFRMHTILNAEQMDSSRPLFHDPHEETARVAILIGNLREDGRGQLLRIYNKSIRRERKKLKRRLPPTMIHLLARNRRGIRELSSTD